MNVVVGPTLGFGPNLGQGIEFILAPDEMRQAANEHASVVGDVNYRLGQIRKIIARAEQGIGLSDDNLLKIYLDLTAFFIANSLPVPALQNNIISTVIHNFEEFLRAKGVSIGTRYAELLIQLLEPRNRLGLYLVERGIVSPNEISQTGTPVSNSDIAQRARAKATQIIRDAEKRLGRFGLGLAWAVALPMIVNLLKWLSATAIVWIGGYFIKGTVESGERGVKVVLDPPTGAVVIFISVGIIALAGFVYSALK
jgi:hypothetical protein